MKVKSKVCQEIASVDVLLQNLISHLFHKDKGQLFIILYLNRVTSNFKNVLILVSSRIIMTL